MARPSTDSLSVATVSIPTRPEPPPDLTEYQKGIWRDITSTKPPEWFEADTYPILRAYCTAAQRHRDIAALLNDADLTDPATAILSKDMMIAEDRYAKQLKTLGVAMRLTQQSRYTPQAASTANKKTAGGRKPWES